MTCTRNPCDDWIFPYFTNDDLGPPAVTNNMIIHNDLLWFHASTDQTLSGTEKFFLQAVDIHTGEISDNNLIVSNPSQFAVITKTDPPTLVASATSGLGSDNNTIGHNYVRVPNKNEVARYLIQTTTPANTASYQYLGTSGSAVVETKAITGLLNAISDPTVSNLAPITLNSSIESSAWAAITTADKKIVTQMLRLV